jgi:N-acetylglucosaminyldiphosphoundecaprenol N-acetyl-beta-D-mannosaminyltransferase
MCAGVGATIDFLAGTVRRAPLWMQRSGLEWIFRLLQEPRRLFRRYTRDLWVFAGQVFKQWWQLELPQLLSDMSDVSDWSDLFQARYDRPYHLLDLSQVEFIDSTGVGQLIRLKRDLGARAIHLVLIAPSKPVRTALAQMHMQEFFECAPDREAAMRLIQARADEQSATVLDAADNPPDRQTLVWRGEVTAANADEVWEYTRSRVGKAAAGQMIVDLSGLRFIDSSGLGLMVRAKKLAQKRKITLAFTNPQEVVLNVIHLARLESLLLGDVLAHPARAASKWNNCAPCSGTSR